MRYYPGRYDPIHACGDTKDDLAMPALADHRWYQWREQPASVGAQAPRRRQSSADTA